MRKVIFPVTLLTAIVSMALFVLALLQGWFGAFVGVGDVFCETMKPDTLIKQPANTWSNVGFIAVGLIMAWSLQKGQFDRFRNSLTTSVFYATFFSCITVLLGPGSMALHATGSDLGGFFDMFSMYLIAAFTTAYSARRLFRLQPVHFTLIFTVVLLSCLWADGRRDIHILFDFFGVTAFAFYITLICLFEAMNLFVRRLQHNSRWAWGSLGALLLAFFIWNMSLTGGPWCNPSSLLQGHAAWHLLDALSVYCLFRYYVSEHRDTANHTATANLL